MDACRAIMTTDTFPKLATRRAEIDGVAVTINGICKGSGMIAPDMATMLAYVFTDAALSAPVVQALVAASADKSFNCMTVDSDTSTSDTLLMFATGKAKHAPVTDAHDPRLAGFRTALDSMLIELAQLIAKDGEGASKFIEIHVSGAEHDKAAKRIALSIANSPLVKTAIAGEDANWGRIVMAVGKAGERADRDKLMVAIGGVTIARDGEPVANYDETPVVAHMKGREIRIDVDAGVGTGKAIVWTCDLTHGYIDINGSYRT
jgi:glutamate N-acetyltransferase/amino-acid N-acetyltransferase